MARIGRIGVFGGTFDPPHVGHLIVAQDVVEALRLDRLLLVPVAEPPHKPGRTPASADARARMLEAAVAGDPRMEVSRVEIDRGGPSYTVDTLRWLRGRHPEDEIHLVVGVDQLRGFARWREPEEVARLARLVVLSREGVDPARVAAGVDVSYRTVPVTRVDVSSSDVRGRIREGRSVRYQVPEAVRRIIEEEQLYRQGETAPRKGAGALPR